MQGPCVCVFVCDRNIDHWREEYGPPEEEWCNKAQRPATSHKDGTQMMMMAPSNLMGCRRRWVRVEGERIGGVPWRSRRDHELWR